MAAPKARRAPPVPDRREEPGDLRCDVCGGPAYEARCKIICRHCGYTRDCSDP